MKSNKVVFKYPDPNAHVRMFNCTMKGNAETFEFLSSMCLVIR